MSAAEPLPIALRDAVVAWYRSSGRVLPFRATSDPYAIFVSEVMAQQTQISRVVEAWDRFLARFPTIATLAAATPADVLREWRGMGYNRRALNLLRAARVVVAEHGGVLPRDVASLERLPGVGRYTARAVAALAFGEPVGAVDTNVRRVVGRAAAGSRHGDLVQSELQALADAIVPADAPGEWTHALMDVGAMFCRPRDPRCAECPAAPWCRFAADGAGTRSRGADGAGTRSRGADGARTRGREWRSSTARATGNADSRFETTNRWLRGRILDRLRDVDPAGWTMVDRPIGGHDLAAVDRALDALADEGMIEISRRTGRRRVRLARH